MKGFIVLTMSRCGSTWLGSLTNATGQMGNSGEWLQNSHWPKGASTAPQHFEQTIQKSRTENDRFGLKVMVPQLHQVYFNFGYDFIRKARAEHDLSIVILDRHDRLGQAISWSRAFQTKKYHAYNDKRQDEVFDFANIAKRYALMSQSMDFWRSYCELQRIAAPTFFYEDLIADPTPFLDHLSAELQVAPPFSLESTHKILRDDTTEIWRERFLAEAQTQDMVQYLHGRLLPARNFGNLMRFLKKEHTKPYPFHQVF